MKFREEKKSTNQLIVTIHYSIERINVRYFWVSGKKRPLRLVLIVLLLNCIIPWTYICSIAISVLKIRDIAFAHWRASYRGRTAVPQHLLVALPATHSIRILTTAYLGTGIVTGGGEMSFLKFRSCCISCRIFCWNVGILLNSLLCVPSELLEKYVWSDVFNPVFGFYCIWSEIRPSFHDCDWSRPLLADGTGHNKKSNLGITLYHVNKSTQANSEQGLDMLGFYQFKALGILNLS